MLPQRLSLPSMQTTWAQQLDPVIANPLNNSLILKNISLVAGSNVIPHLLGRKLVGWIPTRVRASATLYDTQDASQTPQLTLTLVASAPVVVDLAVF
jgi:hypothetical protein